MTTAKVMLNILIQHSILYVFTATGCEVITQRETAYYSSSGYVHHNPIKVLQDVVDSVGGLTKITSYNHLPE